MNSFSKYAAGFLLVLAATLAGEAARLHLSPTNMVMLYLLAVVLSALKLGLRPAIVTAALGVLAFDFFFVPPRFSLTVADKEYLITFLGLFTVGVVISSLVSQVRDRAEELRKREAETASLYRLSRDLASAPDSEAIFNAIVRNASDCFTASAAILLPEDDGLRIAANDGVNLSNQDMLAARWCMTSRRRAGCGTYNYPDAASLFLPLIAMGQCNAILALSATNTSIRDDSRLSRIIEGFAVQLKMALVRVELTHQAEQAHVIQARENLERALLNSISHDLRTPLVTVNGVLSTLRDGEMHLDEATRRELLDTASAEAERLNRFVSNLLDMTRIEAGAIKLNSELCDVQELVGCALAAVEQRIGSRAVEVVLSDDLPLVPMDLVLMTQVLANLLDNSLKYSSAYQPIEIAASLKTPWLVLEVADHGPGVADHDLLRIFEKFYRVPIPEGAGGTGLGLSICKGIIEAHGGRIFAENRSGHGLKIVVFLPILFEEKNHDH
jgi:two-component system sensor histidine kinase KdpD